MLPERHPNLDFFVCDFADAIPKDDLGSMEHPMFTLSTKPDLQIRHYEHNGNSITITPSVLGLATIFDKDIVIYCISQIVKALEENQEVNRKVRLTAYDLLTATNRPMGGRGYKLLQAAFDRLSGTRLKTNIKTNGVRTKKWFGLIEDIEIIERSPTDGRMIAVEITLSEWLFNAITAREVLTIDRKYFRLRKPLDRRLYELARKHCGHQVSWKISLELLHRKSGATSSLREFRRKIKKVTEESNLPEYRIVYDENSDMVTFYSRSKDGNKKQLADMFGDVAKL